MDYFFFFCTGIPHLPWWRHSWCVWVVLTWWQLLIILLEKKTICFSEKCHLSWGVMWQINISPNDSTNSSCFCYTWNEIKQVQQMSLVLLLSRQYILHFAVFGIDTIKHSPSDCLAFSKKIVVGSHMLMHGRSGIFLSQTRLRLQLF